MSDAAFFAMLCDVQLRTDRSVTFESRTLFSSEAPIQHLIEESSLTFAPGLADMIRSPDAPSVQQLRACSVTLSRDDLTLKWIVYLQYYRKGPLWAIYCGKTTNARGSQERLMDYEYERRNIPDSIKDLLERGFERTSHTNLAAVDIPFEGEDVVYVVALVTALEATFATGFWAYSRPTLGSVTPLRFWEEVPWLGLCSHSSLMEITFAGSEDDLPNLDELRLAWKEHAELATKKYRNSEKGQASLDKRKDELKEAYRTDEEFRESRLTYSKQYTASGKQAIARAKYKASAKGKSTDKAYRNSEAAKAKKNESQRRRRAAAKAKKQLEVEEEGCD